MGQAGTYRTVEPCIRRYIGTDGKAGEYVVAVEYQGQRATGRASTLAKARDLRDELRAKVRSGLYDPQAGRRSVSDMIDRYTRSDRFKALTPKDQRQRLVALAWWKGKVGGRPANQLTAPVLVDHRDELAERFAPATVCRYMSYLSGPCSEGVEAGWIPANPVRGLRRPRVDPELGEILTDAEVYRLLAAAARSDDHRLRYLVPCLLSCGARISEYMTTRHAEVDLVRGTSLIRRGKSGKPRVLRYHGRGLEALREAMAVRSITGYLWASRGAGGTWPPNKPMYAALKAAEITKAGAWHLLRRTSATWLASMGASDHEIKAHLGHAATSGATERYVQLGAVTRSELAGEFVSRRAMAA